jgi:hypothetical protein
MQATSEMKRMRNAGESYQKIADKLGVAKSTIQKAFGAHPDAQGKSRVTPGAAIHSGRTGRSLTEFRQAYDKDTIVPCKIRAALKLLGNGWEYEVQFAKLAGLSMTDVGNYREAFPDNWHQIKADGRKVWSGSKAVIAEIRKVVC